MAHFALLIGCVFSLGTAEVTGISNLGRISIGDLTIFGSGFEVTC